MFVLVLLMGACGGETSGEPSIDGGVEASVDAQNDVGRGDGSMPDAAGPTPLDVRAAQILEARCASSGCHGRVCASADLGPIITEFSIQ